MICREEWMDREMSTIIEIMLAIRERYPVYYHKDTKQFDRFPYSGMENPDPNAMLPIGGDRNTIMLPTYEEIDHKDIMRFYVREWVEDKGMRRQLFDILRRRDYMDAYLDKLHELNLYEDFVDACGDVYIQIFDVWAEKNDLNFTVE